MSNDEWIDLVEHWKDPHFMVSPFLKSKLLPRTCLSIAVLILPFLQNICQINKANRAKVKYSHKTGSRSYVAHVQCLVSQDLSSSTEYHVGCFKFDVC